MYTLKRTNNDLKNGMWHCVYRKKQFYEIGHNSPLSLINIQYGGSTMAAKKMK